MYNTTEMISRFTNVKIWSFIILIIIVIIYVYIFTFFIETAIEVCIWLDKTGIVEVSLWKIVIVTSSVISCSTIQNSSKWAPPQPSNYSE